MTAQRSAPAGARRSADLRAGPVRLVRPPATTPRLCRGPPTRSPTRFIRSPPAGPALRASATEAGSTVRRVPDFDAGAALPQVPGCLHDAGRQAAGGKYPNCIDPTLAAYPFPVGEWSPGNGRVARRCAASDSCDGRRPRVNSRSRTARLLQANIVLHLLDARNRAGEFYGAQALRLRVGEP